MTTQPTVTERPALVGNRMVLAGSVLYLLEWVAIIAAGVEVPQGAGASASDVASAYAGNADAFAWAAGWFSVVLLGRVLVMTGLRTAFAATGRPQPLMDLAVAAMAVSVAIEIAVYGVAAGASWSVGHGASAESVRTLDSAAYVLNYMIYGPLGVSLLCAGAAMWLSGLFGKVLAGVALVAGVLATLLGLAFVAPKFEDVAAALLLAPLLMWIWMLWTAVLCWRATPPRATSPAGEPGLRATP